MKASDIRDAIGLLVRHEAGHEAPYLVGLKESSNKQTCLAGVQVARNELHGVTAVNSRLSNYMPGRRDSLKGEIETR